MDSCLDQALENVAGPALIVDGNGLILRINPPLEQLLGWGAREAEGHTLARFVVGGNERVHGLLQQFSATGNWLVGFMVLNNAQGATVNFPCEGKVWRQPTAEMPALLAIRFNAHANFSALNRKIEELHIEVRRRLDAEYQLHLSCFALDHASDGIFWITPDGKIEKVNEQASRKLGYSREELENMWVADLDPDFPQDRWPAHWQQLREQGNLVFESRHRTKHGEIMPVEISATYLSFEGREHNFALARDISERKHAEEIQHKLNRALRMLSDCNMALVHEETEQGLLNQVCRLIVERGGYRMAWVGYAGAADQCTIEPVSAFNFPVEILASVQTHCAHGDLDAAGKAIRTGIVQVARGLSPEPNSDSWNVMIRQLGYQALIALPLQSEGQVFGVLVIYSATQDAFVAEEMRLLEELADDLAFGISTARLRIKREEAEKSLAFLAHHDALTHLPNRILLRDRFDQAVALAARQDSGLALLFLDLDNFKQINDSLGHDMGDKVLLEVVNRVVSCMRNSDTLSRHGGDEFIVLLPGVKSSDVASDIALKIIEAFDDPLLLDSHSLHVSFSIGIALFPSDGRDFTSLLKKADTATYYAKDSGRNTFRFFTEQMNQAALEQIRYQMRLRSALRQGEFLLHYQPQIRLTDNKVIGVEALIRWQHPEDGLVSPAHFIPAAEQSGLIIPIGEWVLDEACRQIRLWRNQGLPAMVMSVNLSALQFKRGNILSSVTAALARHNIPAATLELELTESLLLQDVNGIIDTLSALKNLGVKLAIDDFGTGYSSFAYLKRLQVDRIKIDQSFVRDMEHASNSAIVQAMVQLGQILQLSVIAEGVETGPQVEMLRGMGCNELQGYYFSRPLPAEDFTHWLRQRQKPLANIGHRPDTRLS